MSEVHSTKICKQCGIDKKLEDYTEQPNGKYGRTSRCRECLRGNNRAYKARVNPPHTRYYVLRQELEDRGLKRCNGCGWIKKFDLFHKARRPDGYKAGPYCKRCDSLRFAAWKAKNPGCRKEYYRAYSADETNARRRRSTSKQRRQSTPRRSIQPTLIHAIKRSMTENPITLDEVMALWEENKGCCAVSGIEMTWGQGRTMPNSVSLDRIDHDGGYTNGNVRLVCHNVNAFRGRMSDDEMLAMAKAIVANMERKE